MPHRIARRAAAGAAVLGVAAIALVQVSTHATHAGAATVVVSPTADASVLQTAPTTRYGTRGQLNVDGSPVAQTFLRFNLAGVTAPVGTAKLRLHVDDVLYADSPAGGTVASSTNVSWPESTVTWNTRPPVDGSTLATIGAAVRNRWVEVDVTAFVTARIGKVVTFAITSRNTDGADYDSRETGATAPRLVVTAPAPTTTAPPATTTAPRATTTPPTTAAPGTTTPPTAPPTTAPPVTGTTIAAVGDLVCPPGSAVTTSTCHQKAISDRIVADPSVAAVLLLGDLQYNAGELSSFQTAFEQSYGRLKATTKPAPGNHEYGTPGAAGYFTYFGAAAGDPTKGYYSFDVGSTWHVIALNSNCTAVACAAGSAQEQWLRADLAATTRPCTIAYWHHPRFSSGLHGDNPSVGALWSALADAHAELVLNGHDHDYERFDPQRPDAAADPNGIRELVVGTGGMSLYPFGAAKPNSATRISTFGSLSLTLGTSAYSWRFVDESGTVLDAGTGTCH